MRSATPQRKLTISLWFNVLAVSSAAWEPVFWAVAQMRSILTRWACEASASRSRGSDVRTVPPGSAPATTSASTAEPRRACRRRKAARLASRSPTSSTMSHVLRNLFAAASRPACPWRHSTRTTGGTVGGHKPSSRSARISAATDRDRSARRLTALESRTSLASTSLAGCSLGNSCCDGGCPGAFGLTGPPDLRHQTCDVPVALRQQIETTQFSAHRVLQEFRRR